MKALIPEDPETHTRPIDDEENAAYKELLQQAQQNTSSWWLILYPSLLLFLTMLLTVFVGEGLRDAFDPKPNARYR